jgi:hypothetical protein
VITRSTYKQWMRFSFGPPIDDLRLGLDRLEAMLGEAAKPKARSRKRQPI